MKPEDRLLVLIFTIWAALPVGIAAGVVAGVWYVMIGPAVAFLYLLPTMVRVMAEIARHGIHNDR